LGLIPLLAVGVWCTYRFGTLAGWWNPLTRPRNVSAGARHVFTWESSAWFDCNIDTKRDVNVCWAWDSYGRLLTAGDFRLRDENRAARKDELRPSITGPSNADGISDTIYLFGPNGLIMGRALVRIGDVGGAGQKRISQ
jgi:hypothetical protein